MALSVSHVAGEPSEPVLDTTVGDTLRKAAEAAADRLALVRGAPDPGARRRWSFGELLADAECVARALLGRFEPGDHVAVWAPNIPEWVLLQLGAGLAPGKQASEQDLHRFVREQLAPHKTPREWIILDELPLTASGKIQKFVLRDRFLEARRDTPDG